MKIKKETLTKTIKCADKVSAHKNNVNNIIINHESRTPRSLSEGVRKTTDEASVNDEATDAVCAIKTQGATSNNSSQAWQSEGILRQALLSRISSSGQIDKSDISMCANTVLPKMQANLLAPVDEVKLSEDLPPVPVSNNTLSQESFNTNEFPSSMSDLPPVTSPFSLSFCPLSNSISSNCSIPTQESLSIINQIQACNAHQPDLSHQPNDILSHASNDSVSNPDNNSPVSGTSDENLSPLVSSVASYTAASSNLVCQALASLTSKENSVTVVYSSIPKAETLPSNLVRDVQKTVPLPSMSEVKSSLSNHLNALSQSQHKSSNSVHEKVTLAMSGISSSSNQTLSFDTLPSSEVDGALNHIKLDEQSSSSDFNGESSVSSEAVKFNTDPENSDITSNIVIPVSSDVILAKIDGQNHGSHQDISHIITIPIPAGTIYNSSLSIPMPLPLPSSASSGSSVQVTPTIVSNLPYSVSGISNQVSNWPGTAITLSVTSTSNSQISTSVTTSLPVSIMSVAPSLSSLPTNNLVHFTSNSGSLSSQVGSSTVRTMPQDPICYTVQSPAEILSQLSKAGVFPSMSSSQVSSVLSALGSDAHVDLEADTAHHSEILANQILPGEKVSTLTQTDSIDLSMMQPDEKLIQLLSCPQILEHSINGSQIILPPSDHTPSVNSDTSLTNGELSTENVDDTKQTSSSFSRIVAMVLNAPSAKKGKRAPNAGNSKTIEVITTESHSENTVDSPGDSLRDFLVLPSNSKPQRKRPKRTNTLREMLLGSDESSQDQEKLCKRARGRPKRTKVASPLYAGVDCEKDKINIVQNQNTLYQGVVDTSSFSKEAGCYKCKSCPFLSLEESNMMLHVKERHCSNVQDFNVARQELKCPGCANVFFTVNSLEVHLKQDHQVNTPELKAITSSVIRIATEQNIKVSPVRKKKKKPVIKCEGKPIINSTNETSSNTNGLHLNEDIIATAGPSNCHANIEPPGALIFSTNNNSESDILCSDKKICVKDLGSSNSLSSVGKSIFSLKSISVNNIMEKGFNEFQDKNRNNVERGNLKTSENNCDNSDVSPTKLEKPPDIKTDEAGSIVTQKKKRGRPKGSKSSTLIAEMMGNKEDGQSPKKTNSGHRCNVDNCAVTMRSPENIEYHRTCHAGVEYCCPECSHTHCHWNGMSTHLWRVHLIDMELYTCDQCNYKTVSYAKLINLHKWIHGSERPFLCDSCGKGFKNRKQLRNHKTIHQPKQTKVGDCEICGRTFTNTRMLRMHLDNVHNKLRPHLCNYCGYSASSVGSLKMHMRKHTGEKPFRCQLCDYCTADHNSLRRHKMRHTGDKPYKCPHCPYACIQSSTYKAHLKTKHPGMDDGLMFSCNICSFRSVKEENYIAHLAEHKSDIRTLPARRNRPNQVRMDEKFDLEDQSDSVIELVEHLEDGTGEHFSICKVDGLDVGCDVQISLESDFETEEITGDISEAELITGDLGEPQDFKMCETELKIKSAHDDLHSPNL